MLTRSIYLATLLSTFGCGPTPAAPNPGLGAPKGDTPVNGDSTDSDGSLPTGSAPACGTDADQMGCACSQKDQSRSCFTGDSARRATSGCSDGTQTCVLNGEFLAWSACSGDVIVCGECSPGASRSCYSGAVATAGVGVCQSGEQTCGDDALFGACSGDVEPAAEICGDELDNDCDGSTDCDDSDCGGSPGYIWSHGSCVPPYYVQDFQPTTFDVAHDGSAIAVGSSSGAILAHCFDSQGITSKGTFTVANYDASKYTTLFGVDVAMAADSKQIAITWNFGDFPNADLDWQTWVAFYDASCNPVGSPHLLDPSAIVGINRYASVQMSNDGQSAFIYEAQSQNAYRVILYAPSGSFKKAITIGAGLCENGALGRALGIRRNSGDVVAACENGSGVKYYQRFDSIGAPLDASMVVAHQIDSLSSIWSLWFLLGYNDDGYLAFASEVDYTHSEAWKISFYSPAMSVLATTGLVGGNDPAPDNDRILVKSNGDFITSLHESGTTQISEYSASGAMVSMANGPGNILRIDGADHLYQIGNLRLVRFQ